MTDKRGHGRATGRPLPNVAGDHRLNDLTCGHLGRLTYIPAGAHNEQQTGRLHTTRTVELTPHFQQIIPFEQLSRPTRSVLPESKSSPWRTARSQRNWLLKSHPETLFGNPDLASFLPREIRSLKATPGAPPPVSPLLALGEISDLSNDTSIVGQPAAAFAAGEGGHILQILPLAQEERSWDDESLAIRLSTAGPTERGQWIDDGTPISKIKFAVDPRRHDQIRWILVQKVGSTTVLEPEVRKTPPQGSHLGGLGRRGALQISANPLFTISADQTGGGSQSDVSFNPASDGAPPQLAIINTGGYWSIWDVTGNRVSRPKLLRPVLRACGSIDSGLTPVLPLASHGNHSDHRVSWISRSERGPSAWSRPSGLFDEFSGAAKVEGDLGRKPKVLTRSGDILVCNDTSVRVFGIAEEKFQAGLNVARSGKAERVLDVQMCPFDHSKAFVLTTTTLFWISNEPAGTTGIRLAVVISSPHHKKPNDGTLRLSVSPEADFGHTTACFACVYSSGDAQVSVFWFTKPTTEVAAQLCSLTVRLDSPVGLNSMTISSLPSLHVQEEGVDGDERASALSHAQFFQLFILGPDMGLEYSAVAWSSFPFGSVQPPTIRSEPQRPRSRRKRTIHRTFAVPDGTDDQVTSPAELNKTPTASEFGRRKVKKNTVVDFTFLSGRLQQITGDHISRESSPSAPPMTPFPAIHAAIERGIAEGHSSIHLPYEMAETHSGRPDANFLQQAWKDYCNELQHGFQTGSILVVDRQAYVFHPDSQSLSQSIASLGLLPEKAPELFRQRWQDIVQRATAEAYISLLGLSVAPQLTPPPDGEDVESEGAASQPMWLKSEPDLPGSPAASLSSRSGRRRGSSTGPSSTAGADTDQVITRLRKYLPTVAGIPPRAGGQPRLLSHWPEQPGSSIGDYSWNPEESGADEEIRRQRRRKEEARRRRLARRVTSLQPDERGESSTQPLPRTAGIFSSQDNYPQTQGSTSLFSSQPMSQIIPGPHGGRPPQLKKKKPKVKRGFR